MRLLHFSDPHVQLRDWRTRPPLSLGPLRAIATVELWKGRGARFDGAEERVRALARLGSGFDHVVCTGDFTQLGTREEMALARAALEPLASDPARFTGLAGNHDRFPSALRPVRFFEELFPEQAGSDLPGFDRVRVKLLGPPGGAALLSVESAVPYSWPVIARGRIARADLAQLEAALAHPEVRDRCALVLTHHCPVRESGKMDRPWHYLANAQALLSAMKRGGAAALLAGHVHERFDHPATAERPRILCAGSATHTTEPGAFAITVEEKEIARVERLAF